MKRLGLLRHAKSSWDDAGLSDFDRPLNKRGLRDAPRMGALLRERDVAPQRIISSTAVRARCTAELAARELGIDESDIRLTDELYHAGAGTMLDVLTELGDDKDCVILVGHNPGITSLANFVASDARIDNLPTAGFFYVESDISEWPELRDKPGKLVFFASPKNDLA
ncbi:MAG: histidine phosphatase family protein [Gammaproteobacteria bacterium]|nr:histidine phosphatase family protein [Gammaproteobacteria bacterium]NND53574.1 histidine phosphatase family protein [Gammaproteobacteria bacterium]